MFEIIFAGVNKFAKLVGGDDAIVVELSERILALMGGIMQMDGEKFIRSLEFLEPEKRQMILGADAQEKFEKTVVCYKEYKKLAFFQVPDDEQLLSANSVNRDYGAPLKSPELF